MAEKENLKVLNLEIFSFKSFVNPSVFDRFTGPGLQRYEIKANHNWAYSHCVFRLGYKDTKLKPITTQRALISIFSRGYKDTKLKPITTHFTFVFFYLEGYKDTKLKPITTSD